MCLMVYMATRNEIALRESDSIQVCAVEPDRAAIRQWFSLPNVRFIGAHSGCSCGFPSVMADEPIEYYDGFFDTTDEDFAKNLQSVRELFALIAEADGEAELFPVWAGDEADSPAGLIELRFSALHAENFFFNEHYFYRIAP